MTSSRPTGARSAQSTTRTPLEPGAGTSFSGQQPSGAAAGPIPRADVVYTVLAAAFSVVLVLTNIVGVKLFELFVDGRPAWIPGEGPLTLTSGIITYPLTFLITDLVSELWGRRRADLMVKLGFAMSFLMLFVIVLARGLPPSALWENQALGVTGADAPSMMQAAFELTFYYPGLLLFASMSAYLVAQLFDVRLYHFWWRVTGGRWMFVRNNGSTMISQLVDTIIVNGIFLRWGLGLGWAVVWEVIAAVYLCKVVLALGDTPLIYLGRALLRRYLGLSSGVAPDFAPLADRARSAAPGQEPGAA